MKLNFSSLIPEAVTRGVATAATGIVLTKVVTIVFGFGFLIDCRMHPEAFGGPIACWIGGGGILGISGAAKLVGASEYQRGLWTPVPGSGQAKRKEDEDRA